MNREASEHLAAHRKFVILEYAKDIGGNKQACLDYGVPKSSFYEWKKAHAEGDKAGLLRKKPIAKSHPRPVPPGYVEKIIHLRTKYHLGPQRIAWYIERYQHTANVVATRVRALKIYQRHNQKSSIDFIDYVVDKFSFPHPCGTLGSWARQAQFHWHVEDKGIRHMYIKPRSPQLSSKV